MIDPARGARWGLRPAASHIRRRSNISAPKMVMDARAQKEPADAPLDGDRSPRRAWSRP
jgi:hypothetical protein